MVRVSSILTLGNYDSPTTFFEGNYVDKRFKSVFFNQVSCVRVGKLTSDNFIKNNTFIVNLLRRTDRKKQTENEFEKAAISKSNYEFFEAVDGKELELTDKINKLFLGNDFGSRKGFIGCALSHYNLWKQLANSNSDYYTIFEDDIKLCDGFKEKWSEAKNNLEEVDILFLGYHVSTKDKDNIHKCFGNFKTKLDTQLYVGGTYGYIITQSGAKKLLEYIKKNGIKHGIDYIIKIVPELKSYNTQPHILFSEWLENYQTNVDTDIQKDYSSLDIKVKVDENEWVFYEGVDSTDGDIKYVGKNTVSEIMKDASENINCVAFNTLGFLKYTIKDQFTPSLYINSKDAGIYVKRDYLITKKYI